MRDIARGLLAGLIAILSGSTVIKFRAACTNTLVLIPEHATPLDVYQACTKVGLLTNQAFTKIKIGIDHNMITVDRSDDVELLTLHRVVDK